MSQDNHPFDDYIVEVCAYCHVITYLFFYDYNKAGADYDN